MMITAATYYTKKFEICLYLYDNTLAIFKLSNHDKPLIDISYEWNGKHPKEILKKLIKMQSFI